MAISNPLLKNSSSQVNNPTGYFNSVISTIITIFLIGGAIYFLFSVVMSAYKMISSQGDPKKFEEASSSLSHAFIGLIVVFSVFVIIKVIGTVFGLSGLENLQITWPSL